MDHIQRRVNELTENTMLIITSQPGHKCRVKADDHGVFLEPFLQRFKDRFQTTAGRETAQEVFDITKKHHLQVHEQYCEEDSDEVTPEEVTPVKFETDGANKGIIIPKNVNVQPKE